RLMLDHALLSDYVPFAVGWEPWRQAIKDRKARQHHNISGTVQAGGLRVHLKDLCGWAGRNPLADFAASLGIGMPDKKAMDPYKTRMYGGLVEMPERFLDYAVGDVQVLLQVHRAFVDHFRSLQQEALGMSGDDLWAAANIPMTGGALVARTLERFIYRQSQHPDVLRVCTRQQG